MQATQTKLSVATAPSADAVVAVKTSFFETTNGYRAQGAAAVIGLGVAWKYVVKPIGANAIDKFQGWRAARAAKTAQ